MRAFSLGLSFPSCNTGLHKELQGSKDLNPTVTRSCWASYLG